MMFKKTNSVGLDIHLNLYILSSSVQETLSNMIFENMDYIFLLTLKESSI